MVVGSIVVGCHGAILSGGDGPVGDGPVGDGPGGDGVEDQPDASVPPPIWGELIGPVVHVGGGEALGPDGLAIDGRGTNGGIVRIRSGGGLAVDLGLAVPPEPVLPSPPDAGTVLTAADLVGDVTRPGTLRVRGTLTPGGGDAARIITSTDGDIVIEGTLRGAAVGGARQSLVLRAPNGTVFVTGSVETAGGGEGRVASDIEIRARDVIITGQLRAAGEAGLNVGGSGGAVEVVAAGGQLVLHDGAIVTSGGDSALFGGSGGAITLRGHDVWLDGRIDSFGGDVRGAVIASAGNGGGITIAAGASLDLAATLRLRGGAATATGAGAIGGAAGALALDAGDTLRIRGTIDARGGLARAGADGPPVLAGAAGAFRVGDDDAPAALELHAPIDATGGRGFRSAGDGGRVDVIAGGELILGAAIRVDGGASSEAPGAAGEMHATTPGDLHLTGELSGAGGSAISGGAADGGDGAVVVLDLTSRSGDLEIAATGALLLDGGASSGSGRAGDGGDMTMRTRDGDATIAGRLFARGGAASDAGGTGGDGGHLDLLTDANANGIGGSLLVDETGVIDVSGGAGDHGGNARNNGTGGVALFPEDTDEIAVLLNSDGLNGTPEDAELLNLGHIIARGGADDGWGGDIMFHGRRPDSHEDPLPGDLSLEGDDDGRSGDFVAE